GGVAGPDLLAREHPLVADELRARRERGEVAARTGLAVALAPGELARERAPDVGAALLLGAALEQRRHEHVRALHVAAVRDARAVDLLADHRRGHHVGVRARAAVGLRHGLVQVADRDRALAPCDRLLARSELSVGAAQRPALGAECPDLAAQPLVLLAER